MTTREPGETTTLATGTPGGCADPSNTEMSTWIWHDRNSDGQCADDVKCPCGVHVASIPRRDALRHDHPILVGAGASGRQLIEPLRPRMGRRSTVDCRDSGRAL